MTSRHGEEEQARGGGAGTRRRSRNEEEEQERGGRAGTRRTSRNGEDEQERGGAKTITDCLECIATTHSFCAHFVIMGAVTRTFHKDSFHQLIHLHNYH
ncbi:hypothetical protein ACOMHN_061624 [Nucella lapillus]